MTLTKQSVGPIELDNDSRVVTVWSMSKPTYDDDRLRAIIAFFGNCEQGTIGRGYAELARELLQRRKEVQHLNEEIRADLLRMGAAANEIVKLRNQLQKRSEDESRNEAE